MTASPNLQANPAGLLSAPLWRRLCAMVYDAFLSFAIAMLCSFIFLLLKGAIIGFDHIKDVKTGQFGGTALFIFILLSWYGFYYWFWSRNGQTLGMQAWRLRVQQVDGSLLTAKQTALRMLCGFFSLACFGLGYFWCLLKDANGKNRCWHDKFSNTEVVVLPKQ